MLFLLLVLLLLVLFFCEDKQNRDGMTASDFQNRILEIGERIRNTYNHAFARLKLAFKSDQFNNDYSTIKVLPGFLHGLYPFLSLGCNTNSLIAISSAMTNPSTSLTFASLFDEETAQKIHGTNTI